MTLSTSTTYTIHNDNAPDETIVIRPVAGEPGLLEVIRHHGARLPACLILSAQAARMLAVYLEKAAKDADTASALAYKPYGVNTA